MLNVYLFPSTDNLASFTSSNCFSLFAIYNSTFIPSLAISIFVSLLLYTPSPITLSSTLLFLASSHTKPVIVLSPSTLAFNPGALSSSSSFGPFDLFKLFGIESLSTLPAIVVLFFTSYSFSPL